MISLNTLRKMTLLFPEVTEEPHFEKRSFRVKKKIFATYDEKNKKACIKLSEISQNIFSSILRGVSPPSPARRQDSAAGGD